MTEVPLTLKSKTSTIFSNFIQLNY